MIFKKDEADETSRTTRNGVPPGRKSENADRTEGRRRWRRTVRSRSSASGARLDGNLVSAGSLRIDGQVKGQINADGDVTLSPQSQVEADIRAQNVTVAGRFKGNIAVKGKAHLAPRRPRRRQHHVEDARRRRGRHLPRAEHHGRGRHGLRRPVRPARRRSPRTPPQGHERRREQVKVP